MRLICSVANLLVVLAGTLRSRITLLVIKLCRPLINTYRSLNPCLSD